MTARTLAPSAARLDGQRFNSFAALGQALVLAGQEAAQESFEQNRADVTEAKRLRRNRKRREQYAARKAQA
jgi:hypothetical protein